MTGGILGLAGTIGTVFPFSVMGVLSFGLVVVFGVLVRRKRPEARIALPVTLWFGSLGGVGCAFILWANRSGWSYVVLWDVQAIVGLVGMGLAIAGAVGRPPVVRP